MHAQHTKTFLVCGSLCIVPWQISFTARGGLMRYAADLCAGEGDVLMDYPVCYSAPGSSRANACTWAGDSSRKAACQHAYCWWGSLWEYLREHLKRQRNQFCLLLWDQRTQV